MYTTAPDCTSTPSLAVVKTQLKQSSTHTVVMVVVVELTAMSPVVVLLFLVIAISFRHGGKSFILAVILKRAVT